MTGASDGVASAASPFPLSGKVRCTAANGRYRLGRHALPASMEPAASPSPSPSEPRSARPRHSRRVLLSLLAFLSLVAVASGVVVALVSLGRLLDRAV